LPRLIYIQYSNYQYNGQSALLQSIIKSIAKTYTNTDIGGDGQVVVISFSDGMKFELVPAFKNEDSSFTYPDSNNGGKWKITNPIPEIRAVAAENILCNGNLKQLCRVGRAWKNKWDVPIRGLLIDTLAYSFIINWKCKDKSYLYYDWMSRDFLLYLANQNLEQQYWRAAGSNQFIGLEIDEKGHEFEQVAYKRLRDKNQISIVEVYPSLKKVGMGKFREETDLTLRIGQKIIVCELKCTLFPSTPNQLHNYYQELGKGADQAQKKSDFVKDNLGDFFVLTGASSCSTEEFTVLPLVISNLPFATGYAFQNVPVIDLRILEQYLKGRWIPDSLLTKQGFEPLGQEVHFYSSEKEAEERLEEYLKNPPQIQEVRKKLRWEEVPVGNQEKPFVFQLRPIVRS